MDVNVIVLFIVNVLLFISYGRTYSLNYLERNKRITAEKAIKERQFQLFHKLLIPFAKFVNSDPSKMACEINKEALELGKRYAAEAAIKDREFKGDMVIGIGSGSTVVYAVEIIANTLKSLKSGGNNADLNVVFVPSSYQARQLILEHNLTLAEVNSVSKILWTIDGADEVAREDNLLIKGGGGCLTQEKVLAWMSNELYIIADYTKASDKLGQSWKKGIPIEVLSFCYLAVKREIEERFGGHSDLRIGVKKAGPVVTDNGNFILDWRFPENIEDWKNVEVTIKMMPGVVEVGLFFKMANAVYLGQPDGGVEKIDYAAR